MTPAGIVSLKSNGCRIDILPIVKGLVSDAERVREAYGGYEAYGLPLGIEELTALMRRKEIGDECELSELDLVYARRLSEIGDVEAPTPAFCELADLCSEDDIFIIPLDMNNDLFSSHYVESVGTLEFVKEHRMAKKGMKMKFDLSSPNAFAEDWDRFVNKPKGFAKLTALREKYIAGQILDTAKYRKSLLAVIETERVGNVVAALALTSESVSP
ncbi:MAG: hypothetical protein LBT41_04080 [Candidatus Methanoplasma sp.]|jgi:hypothetical protein|nr:hypothetical protein [Candidatus Methanoplasma sp.]